MPDAAKSKPTTTEPPVDLSGKTLGDFHILRKIGQGGMGQVYLARQQSLKREVALKILRRELAENTTALQRFQAEAEAVARISHPNIVQVYAVGEQDGLRYMALEYVDGRNLRDYLERKGPPDLPVVFAVMRQVAAALQRASELGIVHRDVKPENILLTRKVEVKVADFGLSRYFAGETPPLSLTQSGITLGTPLYMSPEQVQGKPVDHRSDLYSFGVTCYHLLTGRPPYRGANAFDVAVQHVHGQPEPLAEIRPDLPLDLCALIGKLMAKQAGDRYQSAKDVIRDLARIQKGVSIGISTSNAAGASMTSSVPLTNAAANLQVSLPGTSTSGSGAAIGPGTIGTSLILPLESRPANRWPWRILGMLAVLGAFAIGWWFLSRSQPVAEKAANAAGTLPDARPPTTISARERQLKDQLRAKTPADRALRAGMDLGLLYIHERRWDEANEVFHEVESIRMPKAPGEHPFPATVVARFGMAVVLAHQDRVKESIEMFQSADNLIRQQRTTRNEVDRFFFANTQFGQAVAAALSRNAETQKLPTQLEWLLTPSGVQRGPR